METYREYKEKLDYYVKEYCDNKEKPPLVVQSLALFLSLGCPPKKEMENFLTNPKNQKESQEWESSYD